MIMNPDRTGSMPEGHPFTNVLRFFDPQRPPDSAVLGPRFSSSLKTPVTRPSTSIVAHRPWEDSLPCEPPWADDLCYEALTGTFPGKPKTFKPVLLYHRPEDLDPGFSSRLRPCCSHVPLPVCEEDGGNCCCFQCHEDAEENVRELFHSALVHDPFCRMGHGVCESGHTDCLDYNCSCGFHPSHLGSRLCPGNAVKPSTVNGRRAVQKPDRAADSFRRYFHRPCSLPNDHFSYPFMVNPPGLPALFPPTALTNSPQFPLRLPLRTQGQPFSYRSPGYPIPHRAPCSVAEPSVYSTLSPFATSPPDRQSATLQPPRPCFPAFARRPDMMDRGACSEIRRALLTNHPVYHDNTHHDNTHHDNTHHDNSGKNASDSRDKHGKLGDSRNAVSRSYDTRVQPGNAESYQHAHHNPTRPSTTCVFQVSSGITPSVGQSLMTSSMTLPVANPSSELPATPQLSPISSVTSDGSDQVWHEWGGRYGSFLQFLNSPDSPCSVEAGSSTPVSCVLPQPASITRPASCYQADLAEQATKANVHTLAGERGEDSTEDRNNRKHHCPYCDVTCTNNGQLKGHLRVHTGERPYKCECGRAFARNEELTRHRRIHSGLRPHVCPICGKRFGRKDHLNKHQKTHLRTSEKKTHACHVAGCQQRYTRSDALARHQWGAHGIKARTSRIQPVLQGPGPTPASAPALRSLDGQNLTAMLSG